MRWILKIKLATITQNQNQYIVEHINMSIDNIAIIEPSWTPGYDHHYTLRIDHTYPAFCLDWSLHSRAH